MYIVHGISQMNRRFYRRFYSKELPVYLIVKFYPLEIQIFSLYSLPMHTRFKLGN